MDIEQKNGAADKPSTASPVPADISAQGPGAAPFRQGRPGRFRRPADAGQPARHGLRSLQGAVRLAVGQAEKPAPAPPSPATASRPATGRAIPAGRAHAPPRPNSTACFLLRRPEHEHLRRRHHHLRADPQSPGFRQLQCRHAHAPRPTLNIKSGRIGFLTETAVCGRSGTTGSDYGYYSPTAGVQWDATRIVTYLTGTMD